jgi:ABC-2 type transport system ATP-binding protein
MNNIIETENLTKTFGNFTAVNKITLKVPSGVVFGFLGPNGSGKSTTIRMICGVLHPTEGEAFVDGMNVQKETEAVRHRIGYMSQKFGLYEDLTIIENFRFYAGIYGLADIEAEKRIMRLISDMDLKGREESLAGTLSGGLKQRLALGCAMIHKPSLLILDEPTAGVDPVSRRIFWDIIHKLPGRGMSVLVTTHYMDEAESCDIISFIFRGKIINTGSPTELMETEKSDTLEDLFIRYVKEQNRKINSNA